MHRRAALVIVLLVAMVGCAEDAPTAPEAVVVPPRQSDATLLEGEWSMVSGEADGQAMPDAMAKTGKRLAKDGETTIMIGGQVFFKANYTIDSSQTPPPIDYAMTAGPTQGKTHLGIYELKGDTVTFCFAAPGKECPTDLTAEPGSERTMSVWRRDGK